MCACCAGGCRYVAARDLARLAEPARLLFLAELLKGMGLRVRNTKAQAAAAQQLAGGVLAAGDTPVRMPGRSRVAAGVACGGGVRALCALGRRRAGPSWRLLCVRRCPSARRRQRRRQRATARTAGNPLALCGACGGGHRRPCAQSALFRKLMGDM